MTPKLILYTDHAEQRLKERGITRQQVRWLLARGVREEQPTYRPGTQRWACRGYLGRQEASVIFIEDANQIDVITVTWHD